MKEDKNGEEVFDMTEPAALPEAGPQAVVAMKKGRKAIQNYDVSTSGGMSDAAAFRKLVMSPGAHSHMLRSALKLGQLYKIL